MSEILEPGPDITVKAPDLIEEQHRDGWAMCTRGDRVVATAGPGQAWGSFKYVVAIREANIRRGRVAHIGSGMCLTAWMLGPAFDHFLYDVEPFHKYRPPGTPRENFIRGDWRTTLTGLYDVIVYDIGDNPDRATLESHLNPGGLLLGLEG